MTMFALPYSLVSPAGEQDEGQGRVVDPERPPLSSQAPPSAYRITPAYRRDHPPSPLERNPKRSVVALRLTHRHIRQWPYSSPP